MLLTALYVPASRPERWPKAAASGADAVIVDLEDAVPAQQKDPSRANVVEHIAEIAGVAVQLRINAVGSAWHEADVTAVAGLPSSVEVRVPKCEDPAELRELSQRLGGRALHVLVESALGVERAFDLARVQGVVSVSLGEADLRSELGASAPQALGWIRGRLVCASHAAGLGAPMGPMFARVGDREGLVDTTRELRTYGFLGRTVIHPSQIGAVLEAHRPSPEEVSLARQVVGSAAEQDGAIVLEDGSFLDRAMLGQHRLILELAARLDATAPVDPSP
ncbi:HpcH/HpaI aldolase/citrate lyase family protein [Propionibacteriaceae bacterium G1746]